MQQQLHPTEISSESTETPELELLARKKMNGFNPLIIFEKSSTLQLNAMIVREKRGQYQMKPACFKYTHSKF